MTPQEKAFELVAKMEKDFQYFASREIAIQHALVAVNEIIFSHIIDGIIDYEIEIYWDSVKQEIEKL